MLNPNLRSYYTVELGVVRWCVPFSWGAFKLRDFAPTNVAHVLAPGGAHLKDIPARLIAK